jgi:drug/metabolite transporter (DMT)-like permease
MMFHPAISFPYMGETYALVTALIWALAVVFFKKSGETFHPVALNLFKNIFAMVLIIPTMYLLGQTIFRPAPVEEYLLLVVSGALGIGISDTLFFKSLNLLGAGLNAIVDCLYAPFIIVMSLIWLDESLSIWQFVGVAMIVSAVLTATSRNHSGVKNRRDLWLGVLYGAVAIWLIPRFYGLVWSGWLGEWRFWSSFSSFIPGGRRSVER